MSHAIPGSSRRDFLKSTAALAGTLAAAPLVHAGSSDLLKVGLIGGAAPLSVSPARTEPESLLATSINTSSPAACP